MINHFGIEYPKHFSKGEHFSVIISEDTSKWAITHFITYDQPLWNFKFILFTGVPEESGESGESEEFGKSEEFGESSSEGRGFQADEPATIEFDDLIARTQASAGKNARALQFDENSASDKISTQPLLMLICAIVLRPWKTNDLITA